MSTSPSSTSTRSVRRTTTPSSATSSSPSTSRSRSRASRRLPISSPSSTVLAVTALDVSFRFFLSPLCYGFPMVSLALNINLCNLNADPTHLFAISPSMQCTSGTRSCSSLALTKRTLFQVPSPFCIFPRHVVVAQYLTNPHNPIVA